METRRWKAFLRMTGETTVDTERDIMTEFQVVADFMKCIGMNYSMIVHVEEDQTTQSDKVPWNGSTASEEQPLGDQ